MASQRELVAVARRAILNDFIDQLQRASRTSLAQLAAASMLAEEFRRRARQPDHTPPPGHAPLPGLDTGDA